MLLIAAAMQEELKVALSQFRDLKKIRRSGVEFWQGSWHKQPIHFLKTGVGPTRSADNLERALEIIDASQIFLIGYAGALDPQLKLGSLVVVRKALFCSSNKANPNVQHMQLDRTFVLASADNLEQTAKSANFPVSIGDALTSSHVWGNPEHKRILMEKFQTSIVDMETAALAGISASRGIPFHCIRVVSDEAEDSFLEPFSYDPSAGIHKRTGQLIRNGNPVKAFRKWKCNAAIARDSLGRFLAEYFKQPVGLFQ